MAAKERDKTGKKVPVHVMAYGVHVFTALGAALGFLALESAIPGISWRASAGWPWRFCRCRRWPDGAPAERVETASRYDGAVLDLVVDFITYVFVPAAILLRPEIMPQPYGLIMA